MSNRQIEPEISLAQILQESSNKSTEENQSHHSELSTAERLEKIVFDLIKEMRDVRKLVISLLPQKA